MFSTGVHLACLAGYLAAEAVGNIVRGAPEEREQVQFDARYRAAFERYLNFLYFFYDHHSDPDSYFWTARKILNPAGPLEARTAFVRLMSGGGDLLHGDAALQHELAARHARLTAATARGQFAAAPGADLFRVRGTMAQMDGVRPRAGKPGR